MQHKKSAFQKLILIILALVLVILVGFGGYVLGQGASSTHSESASDRHLRINATPDEDAGDVVFTSSELGGNFTEGLGYRSVTNVTIEINGETMKLEEALRDGAISQEEIFFYARLDAAEGICEENSVSTNGLTNFTYSYPEYDLRLIYDIYETPDGQQHLISNMGIYMTGTAPSAYRTFYDTETNTRYDAEDWGLGFKIEDVTSSGIKLSCTQTGGQQIGQLYVTYYLLRNDEGWVDRIDGNSGEAPDYDDCAINMDGTTEVVIDWGNYFGELPSGSYTLELYVKDIYDESQVHPLMMDYYDLQAYLVDFQIS